MRAAIFLIIAALLLVPLVTVADGDLGDYGTILFKHKLPGSAELPPAEFPHWEHRMNYKCYVCHDAIFQMKEGADDVSMDEILKGKYCGVCHNGKIAFQVTFETCPRCHNQ